MLAREDVAAVVEFPAENGEAYAALHRFGEVLSRDWDEKSQKCVVHVRLTPVSLAQFQSRYPEASVKQ